MSRLTSSPSNGRRRSSVYNSFQDMLNAGGRNSITNFASSFSRSANFINADFDVQSRPASLSHGSLHDEESRLLSPSPQLHPYTTPTIGVAHDNIDSAIVEEGEGSEAESRSVRSVILRYAGNSTAPQTIFNGINTLIGIGILSLPLGLYYSGWIFGSIILASCALTTQYTAKLLARCQAKDDSLVTYGDIAKFSFGNTVHLLVVMTFSLDLLSAGISMIIVFADSFNALTGIDKFVFKTIISLSFFAFSFVKLDALSHLSLVGIICTSLIVVSVSLCGFIKKEAPGSLIEISPTSKWPVDTLSLFLSIGIFMSPFGGHAIFPELFRDMKHPQKYNKSCTTIFSFTWSVDYIMAGLGYLMFGNKISDQVTKSIMSTPGFPQWIQILICIFMGILPVSKGPLITRPIITMVDQITLKKFQNRSNAEKKNGEFVIKVVNRFLIVSVFFITSLIFTDFGKIMSFLGSAICFAICVIFPLSFYLKLYYTELSLVQRVAYFLSIFTAVGFAVAGTIAVVVS